MLVGYRGPSHYVQGPGALDSLGELTAGLGARPALLIDPFLRQSMGEPIERNLAAKDLAVTFLDFPGEVTYAAIDAMTAQARADASDCVIAVGGGKAIDTGKCVAIRLDSPFISVPTAASTDAPASLGAAVYNEQHVRIGSERLKRHPDIVIADTAVIARAPARLLAAGIGDALSKKFEADAAITAGVDSYHGYRAPRLVRVVADLCYAILREHGHAAYADVQVGRSSEALEAVTEAIILLSPMVFENGGLSFAHSMQTALMQGRGTKARMHGEHIAYALLVQLAVENRHDAFIADLMDYLRPMKLPTSLAELDCAEPTEMELNEIARITFESNWSRNVPFPVGEEQMIAAMQRIEILSARHRVVA